MRRDIFLHIVNTFVSCDEYLQQRPDATDTPGPSTLQKYVTALRQVAYGGAGDMFDEDIHVTDTTGSECL